MGPVWLELTTHGLKVCSLQLSQGLQVEIVPHFPAHSDQLSFVYFRLFMASEPFNNGFSLLPFILGDWSVIRGLRLPAPGVGLAI